MLPSNDLAAQLTLNGAWEFALGDPGQLGEIQVPGAWEAQGYDRRSEGPARYHREVAIPQEWAGSRVFLEFAAVSYACQVAVNGVRVGEHRGLWTPFAFNVTAAAHIGQLNLIEVEVIKPSHLPGARFPFRTSLAGFIPDLGTTFGGLWQTVSLRAFQAWFEGWQLTASPETGELACWFWTRGVDSLDLDGAVIEMSVSQGGKRLTGCKLGRSLDGNDVARCWIPQPSLWSPEDPVLYDVELALRLEDQVLASLSRRVGFRTLSTSGETLLFNGRPALLRGILHWGWEPNRIAPFFDFDAATSEIRQIKRLGFNLIKLCLFVPNQAYFKAADEEGILLWQEWPMWLPEVDPGYAERVTGEYAEYMALVHPHPSVVIYSAGCELNETVGPELLERLDLVMRDGATGALFCDNSGMGEAYGGLPVDFADFADYHTYSDLHFFEEMLDHWRRDWKPPRPLIFGEFCDTDTYRDPGEVLEHNGEQPPWWMTQDNPIMDWRLEARPLLNQAERMKSAGLGVSPQELKQISCASSLAIRKYTLETVRRRAGLGGYVITALRDTPLTTPGIFDDFGRPKWSPEQFLPFNGQYALCLEGDRRRRWQSGGDRVDRFDLQNEWAGDRVSRRLILDGPGVDFQGEAQLAWRLTGEAGDVLAGDQVQVWVDLDGIRPREITPVSFRLPHLDSAQELTLEVELVLPATRVRNAWPLWIYPKRDQRPQRRGGIPALYDPGFLLTEFEELFRLPRLSDGQLPSGNGVVIASTLPGWLDDFMMAGGRMVLLQWEDGPFPALRRPFWREAIRIFAPHPLWERFGSGGDLRFFAIASDVSLDLARLRQSHPALDPVRPVFRRLDGRDFTVSEYLLEARLGRGKLLACTLRLAGGHGRQPSGLSRNVAGQALFWSMLDTLEEDTP